MKRLLTACTVLAALALAAAPSLAAEPRYYPRRGAEFSEKGQFRIKLGLFSPSGESNFWEEEAFATFTGEIGDYDDVTAGIDFLWATSPNLSLMFSLETYEGQIRQTYRPLPAPYPDLSDLTHESTLEITPLTLGLVFYPAGRNTPIVPYIGVGGGIYWWQYTEEGDFCFFDDPNDPFSCLEARDQYYSAEGVEAGWFAMAGLDFRVSPTWSIFAEAKWSDANADLNDDFDDPAIPQDLDLGGVSYVGGFAWRF